jgi:hypothetical protein
MGQLQSLRALKQHAEGYCLLKVWNANCKSSLIYGQAGSLVCDKTAEFLCEVQTCNWTEGHAVDLNVEGVEVVEVALWQTSEACSKRFRD